MVRYFHLESLDIERDFGYSRRAKLHDHGFSDSRVTDMLTDRLELMFVTHCPFKEINMQVGVCQTPDARSSKCSTL